MKESYFALAVFIMGLIGLAILVFFQTITTTNEDVYYVLKESTEAAMFDSIDIGYYRTKGELRIIKEEFVENLTRRFANSYTKTTDYRINVYDIIEIPPKVSVEVIIGNEVKVYNYEIDDFNIVNKIDSILERNYNIYENNKIKEEK